MRNCIRLFFIVIFFQSAQAQPHMDGREGHFQISAFDRPNHSTFQSGHFPFAIGDPAYTYIPVEHIEFINKVPILFRVTPGEIYVSYQYVNTDGEFLAALFNGYEFIFDSCIWFDEVRIDGASRFAIENTRVWAEGNRILVNVAELEYTDNSTFKITYRANGCELS